MNINKINGRCPLQNECEKVCKFKNRENQCEYYKANSRPGYEIADQVKAFSYPEYPEPESENKDNAGNLIYIPVNNIRPHPDNPRKDLGDLTELADSIKAQGILQNLTVVKSIGNISGTWMEGKYVAVIGHRRLAAAKLAGLEEVPCTVSDMDHKTQIATMLSENMQRSDLTVYEQAQGFQMMMDLGNTVNDIAKQTGFSDSTVRRRVKLLELDQEKFKESMNRGATLMDYAELEKIEDLQLRNSVLEKIGTPNFRNELRWAIGKEKEDKARAQLIEQLETFAVRVENSSNLRYIRQYYNSDIKDFQIPEDAGTVKYFYKVDSWAISIYGELGENEQEDTAEKEKRAEQEARRNELKEVSKRAYNLRLEYVKSISNKLAKDNITLIIEYLIKFMLESYVDIGIKDFKDLLDVDFNEDDDIAIRELTEVIHTQPERCLLIATYSLLDDSGKDYYTWYCTYCENAELDTVYEFLEALGYEISDEEQALRDGTHELFVVEGDET